MSRHEKRETKHDSEKGKTNMKQIPQQLVPVEKFQFGNKTWCLMLMRGVQEQQRAQARDHFPIT